MELQYQNFMKEWELTLDSTVLDKAIKTKIIDFEKKLKNNELSDDEIKAEDNEILELIKANHKFEQEDSPEVKAANRKAAIAEAKNEIAEADTIEGLTVLQKKFEDLPELAPFIEKRIEKLQKADSDAKQKEFLSKVAEEIKATDYQNLPALLEKYKDHPEIIKAIQGRIEKEKPEAPPPTLREKLANAKKREWSYDALRAIGITPTGNDMEIEGVLLKRQYLVYVYKIEKVDGKRV